VSTINHNDEKDPKKKGVTLYFNVFALKMLTNDIINDQKGKRADIANSTAQKKRSHVKKMILGPKTPKISTIVQTRKKPNRKSMEQNL